MTDQVPLVFISYSHDSEDHKEWVLQLAIRLVENGVDVLLDQWDLALGDDVPKFMERAKECTRVLMICTKPYVDKADEGIGGVGYEAMIVTGELVKDLGTNKFIPVVRQNEVDVILPVSVSTRRWVDFRDSANLDESFDELLRELHATPTSLKPALGPNPYTDSETTSPNAETTNPGTTSVRDTYYAALNTARDSDTAGWRRLVRVHSHPTLQSLNNWRAKFDGKPLNANDEALQLIALEALEGFQRLFAVTLAGIESGIDQFSSQVGIIDDLLNPKDWNRSGHVPQVNVPEFITYVYQNLSGALHLSVGHLSSAIRIGRTGVGSYGSASTMPLYQRHDLTAWPKLFGNANVAWAFLIGLSHHWDWLEEPFGDDDSFEAGLIAYYMSLSIVELVDFLSNGDRDQLENDLHFDIPPVYFRCEHGIQRKGYRLLVSDPDQVRAIWESRGVAELDVAEAWPLWIKQTTKSIQGLGYSRYSNLVHADLFSEL